MIPSWPTCTAYSYYYYITQFFRKRKAAVTNDDEKFKLIEFYKDNNQLYRLQTLTLE